jgi:hypothetical protein
MSVEVAVSNPNLLSCLSESYSKTNCTINNIKYKLCRYGHLIPKNSLSCHFCHKSISCPNLGEEKVREYFQNALNADFPRVFPTWTAHPGSDQYPLNYFLLHGYNEDLGIAFVYAEYDEKIANTKKKMCTEKEIELVVIPHMRSFSKLRNHVRKKIKEILNKRNTNLTEPEKNSSESSPDMHHNAIVEF